MSWEVWTQGRRITKKEKHKERDGKDKQRKSKKGRKTTKEKRRNWNQIGFKCLIVTLSKFSQETNHYNYCLEKNRLKSHRSQATFLLVSQSSCSLNEKYSSASPVDANDFLLKSDCQFKARKQTWNIVLFTNKNIKFKMLLKHRKKFVSNKITLQQTRVLTVHWKKN